MSRYVVVTIVAAAALIVGGCDNSSSHSYNPYRYGSPAYHDYQNREFHSMTDPYLPAPTFGSYDY